MAFYYGYLTSDVNQLFTAVDPSLLRGLGIYLLFINVITFAVFIYDKRQALRIVRRVCEYILFGLSLLCIAHHKTRLASNTSLSAFRS